MPIDRFYALVGASMRGYGARLVNLKFVPMGLKVAVVVGSSLFAIHHGHALLKGRMSRDRCISTLPIYCVPYLVNIHS